MRPPQHRDTSVNLSRRDDLAREVAEEAARQEAREYEADMRWLRERRLFWQGVGGWFGVVGRALLTAITTGGVGLVIAWVAGWLKLPPSR